MSEIAQLFTEFFRDLDVVPSDVVAGLVLLRHHQKQRMKMVVAQVQFLVLFINFFWEGKGGLFYHTFGSIMKA